MTRRHVPAVVALGLVLFAGASVGAQELVVPDRGQIIFSAGTGATNAHMASTDLSLRSGTLYFAGAELQVRIHGQFGIGILGGANSVTGGGVVGANARLESHPMPHMFVSTGAGPLVAVGGSFNGALFMQVDLTLSFRFTTTGAVSFGPVVAVATNHAGSQQCGVDSCGAWQEPGDFMVMLRAGVGIGF
jgi:hypothetical protein